jgi:hypothetical protein
VPVSASLISDIQKASARSGTLFHNERPGALARQYHSLSPVQAPQAPVTVELEADRRSGSAPITSHQAFVISVARAGASY